MSASVVVFDVGAVLVDWKPERAWADYFDSSEDVDAFMERIDFMARNPRGDGGESFADIASDIADPTDRRLLEEYVWRFEHTIEDAVPGTWDVVDKLAARGVPLHLITNWSAETWHWGVKAHPKLDELFDVTVVSGEEKVMKPAKKIYDTLCKRAQVSPADCVFIDDSPKNVEGAKAAGWDAIHFTNAEALEASLKKRDLL